MDKIELFLSENIGSGYSDADESGSGSGDGYDFRDGSGSGAGFGYGAGYGDGSGDGSGFRDGDGYGGGDGYGIPDKINNMQIYYVDGVPTIITHVVGNIAKGYIVSNDLELEPCYIAKSGNCFAHGRTKQKAIEDLNAKVFSNLDVDEKINEFLKTFSLDKKYKGHEFYKWHNLLTISCDLGRKAFVRDNNLSLDAEYTVLEFIDICRNAWGKEIIKQLENKIKSKEKGEK